MVIAIVIALSGRNDTARYKHHQQSHQTAAHSDRPDASHGSSRFVEPQARGVILRRMAKSTQGSCPCGIAASVDALRGEPLCELGDAHSGELPGLELVQASTVHAGLAQQLLGLDRP